jgi:DNA-binding transcriptional ArsR family regulator
MTTGREREGQGTGDKQPATVVHFTADDLARVRLGAGPAPLVEAGMGFAEMQHQAGRTVRDGWVSQALRVFPAEARPLCDLIPASGPWPPFLDPPVTDLDEGLEILRATPRSRMRYDLAATWRRPGHPPTWLKALADGDREAVTTVVQALRTFYLSCVAPLWPQITASFRSEMADRTAVLAEHGLDGLFGVLHRDLALRDGSLERSARALTRAGMPVRYRLGGQGLQIIPSVLWSGPPLFSIGLPGPVVNTMVYPARHDFRLGNGARSPDLDAVLGRTRASALRALRDSCSTTELAARLRISVSSASEHATALRGAELIQTERHGRHVRHCLTPLGRDLLGGVAGA